MRTLLFGGILKAYGPMTGALDVERNGGYYIGRKKNWLFRLYNHKSTIHEETSSTLVAWYRHIIEFLH